MTDQNNKDPVANGLDVVQNTAQAVNAAHNYSNLISGETLKATIEAIFGGLSPEVLAALSIILIVILIIVMFISAVNPATLFNDRKKSVDYIANALKSGFRRRQEEARVPVANHINRTYGCGGDLGNMSSLNDGKYTYSTWACEITAEFRPDLQEFVKRIDTHAVAVNSTLELLDEKYDPEGKPNQIAEGIYSFDSRGVPTLSDYGRDYIGSYESEYVDHQSSAFYSSLSRDSYKMFRYEESPSLWTEVGFYHGKKQRPVTRCFNKERQVDGTYISKEVACELPHVEEKEDVEEVDAIFGTLLIPMTCDISKYKEEELIGVKQNLVGQELHLTGSGNDYVTKREISSYKEADELVEEILAAYKQSYIYSQPYGDDELVLVDGFFDPQVIKGDINYLLNTIGVSSYADMIYEIRSLREKGLIHNSGDPYLQCTDFVSYISYKLNGTNLYPGGNGGDAARRLIARGWSSDYSAIGRGTILSRPAYDGTAAGHTMIVLGRVGDELIIADANRDHRGGISIYHKDINTLNASVGGRLDAATPPEGALPADHGLNSQLNNWHE